VNALRCVEVRLTIPDNEARTALATLQRLGVPAAALERADLYRCAIEESSEAALDETFRALEPVFNPNKHALRVRDGNTPLAGEVWIEELPPAVRAVARATVPVRIAGRVLPGVRELTRAVAWRLFDAAGVPADSGVLLRATELLCNPAFQKATTS
jgi:hypothetical protein